MKKLFILSLSILSMASIAIAGPGSNATDNNKHISTAYSRPADGISRGSFHSIRIENDIDVVLTETNLAGITVVANDDATRAIQFKVKKGVLHIYSKGRSMKGKAVVYVPVKNLQTLEVMGNSHVSSAGPLSGPSLRLKIHGEATFNIRSNGDVAVESSPDIEIQMSKTVRKCQPAIAKK
ncbi:MAG TPA: DUF2807 domain-containing protein [Ferruginibacter sp.]|nr:DUF2807 domain-containing protein [Ferruginibacter sp.]